MNEILKFWGVLDSRMFSTLSEQERKDFLLKDANELLPKLVRLNPGITEEEKELARTKEYEVSVQYQLVGSYYSHEGTVKAEMLYSDRKGAALLSYIILDKG